MANARRQSRQRASFSGYRTSPDGIITAVTTTSGGRKIRMEVGRTAERKKQDRASYRAARKAAGKSTG